MRRHAAAAKHEPARKAARRTDAPTEAPFRLNALHRDILGLVLAALPVPFRVHVAARVCKKWLLWPWPQFPRSRSSRERNFDDALALLPSLTHVKLRSIQSYVPQVVHLPAAIASVVICTDVIICALPTALTRLGLRGDRMTRFNSTYESFSAMLKASATSLQCLQIRDDVFVDHTILRHVRLPALTSLRLLNLSLDIATLVRFTRFHSSQLVELTLVGACAEANLATELNAALCNPFPSLTALRVPADFAAGLDQDPLLLLPQLRTQVTSLALAGYPRAPYLGDLTPYTALRTIERLDVMTLSDEFMLLIGNLSRHGWLRMVSLVTCGKRMSVRHGSR